MSTMLRFIGENTAGDPIVKMAQNMELSRMTMKPKKNMKRLCLPLRRTLIRFKSNHQALSLTTKLTTRRKMRQCSLSLIR